jgi:hypothetical protein
MSPAADRVIQRLDVIRQKWWLFTLLSTGVLAISASAAMLLVFMLTDALARFSQGPLAVLFGVWVLTTLWVAALVFRRLARHDRGLEAAARRIEHEFPELRSELINLVQLSDDARQSNQAFCQAAIGQAAGRLGNVRFEDAARRESRFGRFRHCMQTPRDLGESLGVLSLLILVALACSLLLPSWGSAAGRLMTPWSFVPAVGSVKIVDIRPKDAEVIVGSSVDVLVEIENLRGIDHRATLWVAPEGEDEVSAPMLPDDGRIVFKAAIPSVVKPTRYRIEVGDTQSKPYTLRVRDKPTIRDVEVVLTYPEYLGRKPDTLVQKDADLEAPRCTLAELRIRPSTPIASGNLVMGGRRFPGRVEEEGTLLVAKLPMLNNGSFTVEMANDAGHTDPNPRVNRIHVLPDKPPTVDLLKPARQENAAPGASVPVMIRATDDYGIGRVRLEMKIKPTESEPTATTPAAPTTPAAATTPAATTTPAAADAHPVETIAEWTKFEGSTTVVLNHVLALAGDRFKPGLSVMIRAVACDRCDYHDYGLDLKPQEGDSGWHVIRLVDSQAKAVAAVEQAENLRGEIWKLLEKQVRARVAAAAIAKTHDAAVRSATAADVRARQLAVQKTTVALVQTVKPGDKEDRKTIARILNQLAAGEMLQCVGLCDAMSKLKAAEAFQSPAEQLLSKQDRIIDVLRKLLDAVRNAQSEAMAEMKKRPGADLPDDVKKKLQEAKKKLDEFLKQQKKVIEASENLAKKPTEDFSEEDEQLLKTLAKTEDDFSKFMKELASDLSKLPEQDFANASLAKELVEIQTELKMAEDALLKKSVDIAVPLEQLGYERAEEMSTNIEKWLPDTPDREKWSQEESLSDADKEAPMAELPGELEDLIGDLMEGEEDLFDEMEDVTSSAADSLDKGAGWDALDGPISNMSARGVTGNRLPNTSEIGGRSGEGRSGKSSGEFVGDEAVGKGGRKTPSRLTPDPIMKGQIKDHSKDPTGGATGGGKESGEGGEGLEGPSAGSKSPRDHQRLAGKQAALRNKAESIDAQFQVGNYHHTDMKKLIDQMRQVEDDLKAGNYQNALRQRQVLADRAGNIRQFLEGEFQVRKDATSNLPGEIQKEILGGMQEASPSGWEELNRQYFERLASSGGDVPSPAAPPAAKPAIDGKPAAENKPTEAKP